MDSDRGPRQPNERGSPREDPIQFAIEETRRLSRMIDGVPREGVKGLKERVDVIETTLREARNRQEHAEAKKEGQEAQIEKQRAQLRLVWQVVTAIGIGGIASFVTWLVNLLQSAGGH